MSFASRFTVFNPAVNITTMCTEIETGIYHAEWVQNGSKHECRCTEESIREDLNKGALTDYKVVPWLH